MVRPGGGQDRLSLSLQLTVSLSDTSCPIPDSTRPVSLVEQFGFIHSLLLLHNFSISSLFNRSNLTRHFYLLLYFLCSLFA